MAKQINNMKQATKTRKKLIASLECFEQRICMASDLYHVTTEIETVEGYQVAEFHHAVIVDQVDHSFDNVIDSYGFGGLPDAVQDGDPWLIDEIGIDNTVVDEFHKGEPGDWTDDPISDSPSDETPEEDNVAPPGLDQDKENVLPPLWIDPTKGSNISQVETLDEGKDGKGKDLPPKPTPQTEDKHKPTPQQVPISDFAKAAANSAAGLVPYAVSATNRNGLEWSLDLASDSLRIEPGASRDSDYSVSGRPSLTAEMQRFSSIDVAFTAFSGNSIPENSLLPKWSTNSAPRYFVNQPQTKANMSKLRNSYSEPSIQQVVDDDKLPLLDKLSEALLIERAREGKRTDDTTKKVVAMVVSHFLSSEMASGGDGGDGEEREGSKGDGNPWANLRDAKEPEIRAPKTRSLQQWLGMIMAGASIILQETSRILKHQNDEEKSLHLKRLSTLNNSSNS
jgi:hypothetical protein